MVGGLSVDVCVYVGNLSGPGTRVQDREREALYCTRGNEIGNRCGNQVRLRRDTLRVSWKRVKTG